MLRIRKHVAILHSRFGLRNREGLTTPEIGTQDRACREKPRSDRYDLVRAERARKRDDVMRFVAARMEALVVAGEEECRVRATQEEEALGHEHLD